MATSKDAPVTPLVHAESFPYPGLLALLILLPSPTDKKGDQDAMAPKRPYLTGFAIAATPWVNYRAPGAHHETSSFSRHALHFHRVQEPLDDSKIKYLAIRLEREKASGEIITTQEIVPQNSSIQNPVLPGEREYSLECQEIKSRTEETSFQEGRAYSVVHFLLQKNQPDTTSNLLRKW